MRLIWWIPIAGAAVAGLIALEVVFNSAAPGPSPAAKAADETTMKEIMDSIVDPNADFVFASIQQISDENGVSEKAPQTDADWAEIKRRLGVLSNATDLLILPGRKAARPEDRSINPLVENEPAQVQELIDNYRPEFVSHAKQFQDAVKVTVKAVDAKDKDKLRAALTDLDKACESCHLRFFYPNDRRGQEAAREEGLIK